MDSLPNQMDKQEARSPQPPSHRWSTSRRKDDNTAWQKCVLQPSKEENRLAEKDFPLPGEDIFDARYNFASFTNLFKIQSISDGFHHQIGTTIEYTVNPKLYHIATKNLVSEKLFGQD